MSEVLLCTTGVPHLDYGLGFQEKVLKPFQVEVLKPSCSIFTRKRARTPVASVGLANYSLVDMLRSKYKSVNFGASLPRAPFQVGIIWPYNPTVGNLEGHRVVYTVVTTV